MHNDCDLVFYIDYVMVLHDTTPIQPYKMLCNGRFVYWEVARFVLFVAAMHRVPYLTSFAYS